MAIPAKSHPKWRDLLTGKVPYKFKYFPLSIAMQRAASSVKFDVSAENLQKNIDHVYEFFVKNEKLMQTDIDVIFK